MSKAREQGSIQAILDRLIPCAPTTLETGCREWRWDNDGAGYGRAVLNGKRQRLHRLVYENLVGPIPAGSHIHHRCENRACANIEHLELVSPMEHRKRHEKTHCPQGHPYVTEGRWKGNSRDCRICHREREYQRHLKECETHQYVRGPYKNRGTRSRRPLARKSPEPVRTPTGQYLLA